MNRVVGYARVSSRDQNLQRQISELKKYVKENYIVIDKASGKDFLRPGYQSLKVGIGTLQEGDTLIITELDRLGRNKKEIQEELSYFQKHGIRVKVLDIPTTMQDWPEEVAWVQDMVNTLLIEVLSAMAEQERLKIRKRQSEGIAAMPIKDGKKVSSKSGKPIGRPKITYPEG